MLLHNKRGGRNILIYSLLDKFCNHIIWDAAVATAQYFASVKDRATVLCFLEHQEMGLQPIKLM